MTGAEAGYVTAGTFSGILLGTAACLTGLDVERMNRLPDTSGMPNEVLIDHHQRSGYDHAIRAAGGKIINIGMPNNLSAPMEVYVTKVIEFEAAMNEHTAAIAYFDPLPGSTPSIQEVIEVGKKFNIPVIVDAAHQVPPVENLRTFISMGADLVAISGGKGIKGPQNSGILCGRKDLIAAVALQNLDVALLSFDTWNPPSSLIPKEKLKDVPRQGIGRGMKVSKEAIVGLLKALEILTEAKSLSDLERYHRLLKVIAGYLDGIPGVKTEIREAMIPKGETMLLIKIDEHAIGHSAFEVSQKLKKDEPPVYVLEMFMNQGLLAVSALNLNGDQAKIVGERLRRAINN
jgi:D-glucosaminate-6-phosphate ammonia-lyase